MAVMAFLTLSLTRGRRITVVEGEVVESAQCKKTRTLLESSLRTRSVTRTVKNEVEVAEEETVVEAEVVVIIKAVAEVITRVEAEVITKA